MQATNVNFFKLFNHVEDYPKNLAESGVPQDCLFHYVPSYFLNGYINLVSCYYTAMFSSEVSQFTTEEKLKAYIALGAQMHTNYSKALSFENDLMNDIIILAETKESLWFFWFDRDVSDCSIGRIPKTRVTKKEFKQALIDFLESSDNAYADLPLPKGTISF